MVFKICKVLLYTKMNVKVTIPVGKIAVRDAHGVYYIDTSQKIKLSVGKNGEIKGMLPDDLLETIGIRSGVAKGGKGVKKDGKGKEKDGKEKDGKGKEKDGKGKEKDGKGKEKGKVDREYCSSGRRVMVKKGCVGVCYYNSASQVLGDLAMSKGDRGIRMGKEQGITDLGEAYNHLIKANKSLGRQFPPRKEYMKDLMMYNWWQIKDAEVVYIIGETYRNGNSLCAKEIKGAGAWISQLAIDRGIEVYFGKSVNEWYYWDVESNGFELLSNNPPVPRGRYAVHGKDVKMMESLYKNE